MPGILSFIGAAFSLTLGDLVTPYSNDPNIEKSQSWRILFAAPLVIILVQFFLLLFVFRLESPLVY